MSSRSREFFSWIDTSGSSDPRLGYEEAHTDKVPEINAAISPIVLISGSLAAYEGIRYLAKLKPQSLGIAIHQNMFDYSNSYTVEVPHECQHRATQE